jgi:copper chaperone CopZ
MKIALATVDTAFAFALSAQAAEVSTKLTDVHLCCQSCVKAVAAATAKIEGLTAVADLDEETVTLTAADSATLQKGVDALVVAGYFGKSSDPSIKVNADTGAKDQRVQSITIKGLHLCCGKCVKSVNETLSKVEGLKENTAAKGVQSFTVTGDFNEKEVMTALQHAGLTGTVAK